MNKLKLALLASATILPGAVFAQDIGVIVNGESVAFSGVGPRQVNGRVLVPLRGVMEKLGAYVGYEGATKTVTASRNGVDIVLRLGDRHATVNGRDVMLDVPAEEYRGSTMVPLRFVGEALGADVRWNAATYTVNITTTDSANQRIDPNTYTPPKYTPPPGAKASVTSFDVDHTGSLRGGDDVAFTLVGTPGGEATFSIPGVIQDVPMKETQAGVYVGTFRVPRNSPINISKANAVARLRVNGEEKMIQSGASVGFDTEPPIVTSVRPDAGSRVTRDKPNIVATLDDGSGSGVDPSTVELRLDNRNVTGDAVITSTQVSYRPADNLGSGLHEVTLTARDRAGNPVSKTWTFRVTNNADVIKSFTYDTGGESYAPGTEVTFTLVGDPGGTASFSVSDKIKDRSMNEVTPGRYVGHYTIRRNDNFEDVPVTAKLITTAGDVFTFESPTRFRTSVRTLEAPSFTDPSDGSSVGDRVVLRGRAAPGSKVRVKVDYSKNALGIFKMNGTVAEIDVTADDQGYWQTDSIDLNTGLGGGSATFNITATTIGSNGKKSSVTKLTLHN